MDLLEEVHRRLQDAPGAGVPLLSGQAGGAGVDQPGVKQAPGRP